VINTNLCQLGYNAKSFICVLQQKNHQAIPLLIVNRKKSVLGPVEYLKVFDMSYYTWMIQQTENLCFPYTFLDICLGHANK
jgi:hypothetical protein